MRVIASTPADVLEAVARHGLTELVIDGTITGCPMVTLPPGVTLRGGTLRFGARGVRLTSDNSLLDITIETDVVETAVLNDTRVEDLGTLRLQNVTTIGQVLLLAEGAVRSGRIEIEGLHVQRADVRGRQIRPHGFGVDVLQGALTVWNRQPDPAVVIEGSIRGVSAGSQDTPVRGSGVFVGGHGDPSGHGDGGALRLSTLRTGELHCDGGIAPGTPDLISGGVFVVSGCTVDEVVNDGAVTTNGQNDMVLDNWGAVETWQANAPITSTGPSGIGFVNFGELGLLDVRAPIETRGRGARGFNLYDGHVREARFDDIKTTGDGSIGIQVSKPLQKILVRGDLTTEGASGLSLVKGVQMQLDATALSIKPGAEIELIEVDGSIITHGDGITAVEILGTLDRLKVNGRIAALGLDADAVHTADDTAVLQDTTVSSPHGTPIVRRPQRVSNSRSTAPAATPSS